MQVIGVDEFGGPQALTTHEVPDPHAGAGEVRIRVQAAAVNPTDTVLRSGVVGVGNHQPPYVPGMDAAGVIDEVGAGSEWRAGDEVMTMAVPQGQHGGAYAHYLVAPADAVAHIPRDTDVVSAATLPMNGLTAWQALEAFGLHARQSLAVTGAAGTLGGYLVQLAKHAGLTVFADAAEHDRALVQNLGADYVVVRGEAVAERVRAAASGGVDAVADAAVQNEQALAAVRDGGQYATFRFWDAPRPGGTSIHQIYVADEYHPEGKLDRLRQYVEDGVLTLRVADAIPAQQAAQAHQRLEAGGLRGRIVLTF